MGLIETSNVVEGSIGLIRSAGAPSAGTTEVQTLTFGGTWLAAETFKLSFEGQTTAAITWSATDATLVSNIDAALEALSTIGTGGITVADSTLTTGLGDATLTFAGNHVKKAVGLIAVAENNSVDGTLEIAETTPGVTATARGASIGAIVSDTTNGKAYINSGTALAPTWTVVGSQS